MPKKRMLACWLGIAALALTACGSGEKNGEPPVSGSACLLLTVAGKAQALPASFVVTFAIENGGALTLACPNSESGARAQCQADGALLNEAPASVEAVVKARFFKTQEITLTRGAACGTLALTPLPAFENVEGAYTTGFAEDSAAWELFASMAVATGAGEEETLAMKFYVDDLAGSPSVYFQNTRRHPLHYEFVHNVLKRAITESDYESQTYHGAGRKGMAGTLIAHPALRAKASATGGSESSPLTLEFFPSDDLTPAQALLAYRLVEERLGFAPLSGTTRRLFYLPAGDSFERALKDAAADFARQDALWLTRVELYGNLTEQLLNPGVAFGTLRQMGASELADAIVSYKDILLLPKLPLDLPLVGGTITEEMQTPLAHVNVAARARHTPNLSLAGAASDARIKPFLGKLVRFEVTATDFSIREATSAEAQAFWDSRKPANPVIPGSDLTAQGLPSFAELSFADSTKVGVKAANLAELHHSIPGNSPDGFAIPFSYYDTFLSTPLASDGLCEDADSDCLADGRTSALCRRVADFCLASQSQGLSLRGHRDRLLADATFAADTLFREAALAGLRYLIHHTKVSAEFASALDARVTSLFGPTTTVRLRSSTNSEDLPDFSGAGLYDSYSAGGADKDPASKVVRKVWASVWNWQAFEEREYWGIKHEAVYMGVAVHPAFGTELANGVIITRNLADPALSGYYVNVQVGEDSVTNPESGKMPEIFSIVPGVGGMQIVRQRYSDLSPSTPILSEEQVRSLYTLVSTVRSHFAPLYKTTPEALVLDIEFKLDRATDAIALKQVRPYAD